MEHQLPQLPYPQTALEPYISSETVAYHHEKHHRGYVTKLNELIKDTEFEEMELSDLILRSSGPVYDQAAQHWNHSFFWECLRPATAAAPSQTFIQRLRENFGGLEEFKLRFKETAVSNFGSGWTWLVQKEDGSLEILNTSNAENPLRVELRPLLTLDVWEHAYYLDYRNSRADFVGAFWEVVNWDFVEANLELKRPQRERAFNRSLPSTDSRRPH